MHEGWAMYSATKKTSFWISISPPKFQVKIYRSFQLERSPSSKCMETVNLYTSHNLEGGRWCPVTRLSSSSLRVTLELSARLFLNPPTISSGMKTSLISPHWTSDWILSYIVGLSRSALFLSCPLAESSHLVAAGLSLTWSKTATHPGAERRPQQMVLYW